MNWLAALVLASLTYASSTRAELLPTVSVPEMLLPETLTEVAIGAPADSLVLRVSFHAWPGDGRFDGDAFLVVEEMRWPPPGLEYGFDLEDASDSKPEELQAMEISWPAIRIEGTYLNRVRLERNVRIVPPGMIDGEVGGHWVRPFKFVKWLGPHQFVVTDGRAFYEIGWLGPGRLELLSVRREL